MDIYTSEITEVLGIDPTAGNVPGNYSLHQNYPNPFNPSTNIIFGLPKESYVTIEIYNSIGQHLKTIASGKYGAGNHSVKWNASGYASGVYFCRLIANDFSESRPMLLVK